MEYTELELNKMIAKLECEKVFTTFLDDPFDRRMVCIDNGRYPANNDPEDHEVYDCFNDWVLLGNLMVRYKVGIAYALKDGDSSVGICEIKDNRYDTVFKSESEIPRAIIMCILISENII